MISSNFTLLYVEDNKADQECISMILEDDYKEFYQAYNGKEGLQIYKDKKPDIIISDVNMPVLDGLSMAKEIKSINSEQIIIIMSAFNDRHTLLDALNIGIDYFIPKPLNMDILDAKLNIILKNLQNKLDLDYARQKEVNHLYNLAHFDALTNIPNRYLFEIKLDEAISRSKRNHTSFALFFIDLNDFKHINDNYGHAIGDDYLMAVAQNIKSVIRTDDFVARIGGDEFALIAENFKDKEYIEILKEKILKSAPCLSIRGEDVCISYSIGISMFPQDAKSKKELLHLADTQMYKVKRLSKR